MAIFLHGIIILNFFLAVTVAIAPPPEHFVVSVTASSDISKQNVLLQFDPDEPSHIFNSVPFPYYESTLWGSLDRVGDRFILLEFGSIQIFDARNLSHIDSLDIGGISVQLPTAMHYDQATGLIWLMWTGNGQVDNQWCAISNATNFICFGFSGQFDEIIDASAFDPASRILWAQVIPVPHGGAAAELRGFNVDTHEYLPPQTMHEICQHMQVASVGGASKLLCVEFTANTLVEVDTATGKTTSVARLPFLHDPVMHTSTMRGNATYMVQLKGPLQFEWVQVDVEARRIVSSHTTKFSPSNLAMPVYV